MKISELIEILQKAETELGDVPVYVDCFDRDVFSTGLVTGIYAPEGKEYIDIKIDYD